MVALDVDVFVDGVGGVVRERTLVEVGSREARVLSEPEVRKEDADGHICESLLAEGA